MKKYLIYVLLFEIFHENLGVPQNSREKEIKALEIEKSELYRQINDAIDDSVVSLKKSNTSDAILGVTYLEDLKKQIRDLNGTESIDNASYDKHEDISVDDKSDLENRRTLTKKVPMKNASEKGKQTTKIVERRDLKQDMQSEEKKKSKLELSYLESMKGKSKKWRNKYETRLKLQTKLDAWIAERERERERIRLLKLKMRVKGMSEKEKCPRQGVDRKGKKQSKKSRRGKAAVQGKKYPCCRKCCKRSYMGCLRKK